MRCVVCEGESVRCEVCEGESVVYKDESMKGEGGECEGV